MQERAREPFLVRVKRVGTVEVPLPRYQTPGSAGMDLHAALTDPILVQPRARAKIPTGLSVAIPHGYEGQVRPRSGLAAKHGITVVNTPGTVDSDYRGEVIVVLVNLGTEPVTIAPLDRIAQIVFARHEIATLVEVSDLDETERGAGGYGSTGG
ncbi:MAG: Deoxyuridine 5-triphosphate nucleotidohydrolase [Labilithrix sp.]|jgi:dUTP pyrophosphatase|nr:Deoxyuridine 5-triphosphate nucleotidohydrolase [Labilithrix sp.]